MATTTHYAVIDDSGAVHGIGTTRGAAERDARRVLRLAGMTPDDLAGRVTVPCTAAAAEYVEQHGGQPAPALTVSRRSGVSLREEE